MAATAATMSLWEMTGTRVPFSSTNNRWTFWDLGLKLTVIGGTLMFFAIMMFFRGLGE